MSLIYDKMASPAKLVYKHNYRDCCWKCFDTLIVNVEKVHMVHHHLFNRISYLNLEKIVQIYAPITQSIYIPILKRLKIQIQIFSMILYNLLFCGDGNKQISNN